MILYGPNNFTAWLNWLADFYPATTGPKSSKGYAGFSYNRPAFAYWTFGD